jgi:hypothetical protein
MSDRPAGWDHGKGTVERLHQLACPGLAAEDCSLIDDYCGRLQYWGGGRLSGLSPMEEQSRSLNLVGGDSAKTVADTKTAADVQIAADNVSVCRLACVRVNFRRSIQMQPWRLLQPLRRGPELSPKDQLRCGRDGVFPQPLLLQLAQFQNRLDPHQAALI